jgi:8-oxo-dGTP diphosphatase
MAKLARESAASADEEYLRVAVGILSNARGEVLISRRPDHVPQGGLWEFPGGKLEAGENLQSALRRELWEELGIRVLAARPLIRIRHTYEAHRVLLEVWRVMDYRGRVQSVQNQPLDWVAPEDLNKLAFPAADRPIITALRLPDCYLVTGEPAEQPVLFLQRLRRALEGGIKLAQLRAKSLTAERLSALYRQARMLAGEYGVPLLLNSTPEHALAVGADGLHLSASRLRVLSSRPLPADRWVAASCHDEAEVLRARRIGVDFIVVSPVCSTPSHPAAAPLGWEGLRALTERANLPVYALGGMTFTDLERAWEYGARGIAAIRALWEQ